MTLALALYVYYQHIQNTAFNQKIEQLENNRKLLMDSIVQLTQQTRQRDEKLRALISNNKTLLDSLSQNLGKLRKNTEVINSRISANQKAIDELWK